MAMIYNKFFAPMGCANAPDPKYGAGNTAANYSHFAPSEMLHF